MCGNANNNNKKRAEGAVTDVNNKKKKGEAQSTDREERVKTREGIGRSKGTSSGLAWQQSSLYAHLFRLSAPSASTSSRARLPSANSLSERERAFASFRGSLGVPNSVYFCRLRSFSYTHGLE